MVSMVTVVNTDSFRLLGVFRTGTDANEVEVIVLVFTVLCLLCCICVCK